MKEGLLEEVSKVIDEWKATDFTSNHLVDVPGLDDRNLTFGKGRDKKVVEIRTCVLYVDIRNSVKMVEEYNPGVMGIVYSIFTHCVILAAKDVGGKVRNVIGDRVMIVFPEEKCFEKAVCCATSINTISQMINTKLKGVEFKCGIGVDYGQMYVMKVGTFTPGQENDDNKGFVWVGYPANYASRLTDSANKTVSQDYMHVEGEFTIPSFLNNGGTTRQVIRDLSIEEFYRQTSSKQGSLHLNGFTRILSIERKTKSYTFPPILLSQSVYDGFCRECSTMESVKNGWWKLQQFPIKDIIYNVYGHDNHWTIPTL